MLLDDGDLQTRLYLTRKKNPRPAAAITGYQYMRSTNANRCNTASAFYWGANASMSL